MVNWEYHSMSDLKSSCRDTELCMDSSTVKESVLDYIRSWTTAFSILFFIFSLSSLLSGLDRATTAESVYEALKGVEYLLVSVVFFLLSALCTIIEKEPY